jgi:hypothetical protein
LPLGSPGYEDGIDGRKKIKSESDEKKKRPGEANRKLPR